MPVSSRREFVAAASRAVAAGLIGVPGRHFQMMPLVISSQSADQYLPDPDQAAEDLRTFATIAVEAARQAGASYADVRVADRYTFMVHGGYYGTVPGAWLYGNFAYGVRVLVDGAWAFVHGTVRTPDALATSARNAVATARGYARLVTRRVELAPTPRVTGSWTVPVKRDPFTVPLQEQSALLGALDEAYMRVHDSDGSFSTVEWMQETRVFASSEGSLVTQRLNRAIPEDVQVNPQYVRYGGIILRYPMVVAQSGGFETLANPRFQDGVKALAERTYEYCKLPVRRLDVGRYPVILDGGTLGMVFARTIGAAIELDRVLGFEADASGTSFMAPPQAFLGTPIASSLLTVTGHRELPSIAAVKWDDEGVESQAFRVVDAGRLTSYVTSRETAASVTDAGRPAGCLVAPDAGDRPSIRVPHLHVAAPTQTATLEDLCRDLGHGVLVLDNHDAFSTDQQLTTGMLNFFEHDWLSQDGLMLEIVKGRPVARLVGNGVRFKTSQFWKALVALGDASTVMDVTRDGDKGMPWQVWLQATTAPAGVFKEVDIVSLDKNA